MICPSCLADVGEGKLVVIEKVSITTSYCPKCNLEIPILYIKECNNNTPTVHTSAVGFSGHGKTAYFASLFYFLEHEKGITALKDLYYLTLDSQSFENVRGHLKLFKKYKIPKASPQLFPIPTMVRIDGIPGVKRHTLVCYDTSGEAFTALGRFTEAARYVTRSKSVFLFVSLIDLVKNYNDVEKDVLEPAVELQRLLTIYIDGMAHLGGSVSEQNLIIVITKADTLGCLLEDTEWRLISTYMRTNTFENSTDIRSYWKELQNISDCLKNYLTRGLGAKTFVNTANIEFKSVMFCMVSALGSPPNADNELEEEVSPQRVLDPLIIQAINAGLIHGQTTNDAKK